MSASNHGDAAGETARRGRSLGVWLLWGIPALVYACFTLWYTDFSGPLDEAEIEHYVERLGASGMDEEQVANVRRFMEQDTGRQFIMVNNIDMAENPPDVEGAAPGESAAQLLGRYMEHMYPALFRRACHPIYAGSVVFSAMDVVGIEGAETWDQAALMRYRSRRDLVEIISNPVFSGRHDFKVAALTKTIAYPVENEVNLGDPRLLLALILVAGCALLHLALMVRRAKLVVSR